MKRILVIIFGVILLSGMLHSKGKKKISERFDLIVKNNIIVVPPSSSSVLSLILKNKEKQKVPINIEIQVPENVEIDKKNETKTLEKDLTLDYHIKTSSQIKPGIYRIEIKARSANFLQNKIIYLSCPFAVQRTFYPPSISESYCKPCYWGGKIYTNFGKDANIVTLYPLWDEKNLYFGINVHDKDVCGESKGEANTEKDDHIQIFINPKNKIIYHYILTASGKKLVRKSIQGKSISEIPSEAEMISHIYGTLNNNFDIDNGYWIIVKIPFAELGILPQERTSFKINVVNFDKRSGDVPSSGWISWSPDISPTSMYNINIYPEINLQK